MILEESNEAKTKAAVVPQASFLGILLKKLGEQVCFDEILYVLGPVEK